MMAVVLLAAAAPILLALYALPQTAWAARWWWRALTGGPGHPGRPGPGADRRRQGVLRPRLAARHGTGYLEQVLITLCLLYILMRIPFWIARPVLSPFGSLARPPRRPVRVHRRRAVPRRGRCCAAPPEPGARPGAAAREPRGRDRRRRAPRAARRGRTPPGARRRRPQRGRAPARSSRRCRACRRPRAGPGTSSSPCPARPASRQPRPPRARPPPAPPRGGRTGTGSCRCPACRPRRGRPASSPSPSTRRPGASPDPQHRRKAAADGL